MPDEEVAVATEEESQDAVAEAAQRPEDTGAVVEQEGPEPQDSVPGAGDEQEVDRKEALRQLLQEDPEIADMLAEVLPEDKRTVVTDDQTALRQAAQQEREARAREVMASYVQSWQSYDREIEDWLSNRESDIVRGADDLLSGRREDKNLLGDAAKAKGDLQRVLIKARASEHDRLKQVFDLQMEEAFSDIPLSKEDRSRVKELGPNPGGNDQMEWLKEYVSIHVSAIQRDLPDTQRKKVRSEVEKELAQTEKWGRAMELLETGRRKASPKSTASPAMTQEQLEHLYAQHYDGSPPCTTCNRRDPITAQEQQRYLNGRREAGLTV